MLYFLSTFCNIFCINSLMNFSIISWHYAICFPLVLIFLSAVSTTILVILQLINRPNVFHIFTCCVTCSCSCVLEVMYLCFRIAICVRIIDFSSFYDFSIGFWNCSDSMVIIFHFILVSSIAKRIGSTCEYMYSQLHCNYVTH
jgi:hypothetical protein